MDQQQPGSSPFVRRACGVQLSAPQVQLNRDNNRICLPDSYTKHRTKRKFRVRAHGFLQALFPADCCTLPSRGFATALSHHVSGSTSPALPCLRGATTGRVIASTPNVSFDEWLRTRVHCNTSVLRSLNVALFPAAKARPSQRSRCNRAVPCTWCKLCEDQRIEPTGGHILVTAVNETRVAYKCVASGAGAPSKVTFGMCSRPRLYGDTRLLILAVCRYKYRGFR